jgi:hypothetical protein
MEIQFEIKLLIEKIFFQFLNIHSNKMKENSFLSVDVDIEIRSGTLLA